MQTVRTADPTQLDTRTAYTLWALREAVFVVEQDCPYQELDGRDLERGTRHFWLAGEDSVPTAYLRVLDEGEAVRIGRVLTHPSRRGQGLARRLMQAALDEIGPRECVLDAQAHLVDWYREMGFRPSGSGFVEDGIPHVPMRREVPRTPVGSR